jgi:hypothetical protein
MMRTATMVSPHELEEREVARVLEQRFGAAWFPEYHRCSIDTDDAFVAVDVDDQFMARLPADERQALTSRLGFVPGTALHVQSSVYHLGSEQLAERVLQALCGLFDGRIQSHGRGKVVSKSTPSESVLSSSAIDRLTIAVEEAARAASIHTPRFVEPAQGTLDRAKARRHHIVFGRRGSGKTSLLAKAAADLTVDRRPIALVNLETFKGHSYPDVLLSVLIETLGECEKWFETAATAPANRISFWRKLFGTRPSRGPIGKGRVNPLLDRLRGQRDDLRSQLHAPDAAEIEETMEASDRKTSTAGGKLGTGTPIVTGELHVSAGSSVESRRQSTERSKRSKIDFLHRHLIDYQNLFRDIVEVSDGDTFLFLDDLYHIKRADQADVIDYFHRIAKGTRLWLKIGTIRHRTEWYRHSDPPIGLKLGDDADEIDLDLTLEKYRITKDFLMSVLRQVGNQVEFRDFQALLAPTAIDRLVLASGGVARDFLSLFRRSIFVARERGGGARGPRIVAQDINQAAGEHDDSKRDELKRDTLEEREQVERAFEKVRTFCLETANANCFLLEKDRTDPGTKLIEELVDLRLIHLVRSRVTVSGRKGKIYVAYMLDLSQYAGERKRRGLEMIEFWQTSGAEKLRRAKLIYEPWQPMS